MDHEEHRRRLPARWLHKFIIRHLPFIKTILSCPQVPLLAVVSEDNSYNCDIPLEVSASCRLTLALLITWIYATLTCSGNKALITHCCPRSTMQPSACSRLSYAFYYQSTVFYLRAFTATMTFIANLCRTTAYFRLSGSQNLNAR